MAIYKPEVGDISTTGVPQSTPVSVSAQDVYNLGTSVKALLDSFTPAQEPEVNPETKDLVEPVITPAMSDSGLSTQAQGFLDAIASAEGTGGDYNIIVGGQKFEGYQEHPNVVGVVTKAGPSTAAGKYQITKQTWDYLKKNYPDLGDFSPQNQDKAAFYLAKERYKQNTPGGRDLEKDLQEGNTLFLRSALEKTWTGIVVDKQFEKRVGSNIKSRSTTVLKPVGFTTIKYNNTDAIRNKPVVFELEAKLDYAVSSVLGTGYTVEVYSGGQEGDKKIGTERHNVNEEGLGLAADVKIYDPEGKQVTDTNKLDALKDHWIKNGYGSVGAFMKNKGMHFDVWTQDKLKPGMALEWRY